MTEPSTAVSRRAFVALVASGTLVLTQRPHAAGARSAVTVWKDPGCSCCTAWIEHLRRHGHEVTAIDATDLHVIKTRLGVPAELASCHTAEVAGYVIEGHVPAQAIARLLAERPDARGLAVPGMPVGSPGMEGGTPEAYDVILFGARPPIRFGRFLGAQPI
jgi:hypothetical protein